MKSRLKQYKSLPLLAGLFALFAFGCVSGERGGNGEPDLPDMVEVDLSVGISNISGSLQTKADAPAALPGEQIHSLVVFIVNTDGKVEKKFLPNLSNDSQALKGELKSWKSGPFEITAGAKRIYAFANWESLKDEPLKNIVATAEGNNMPTLPSTVSWESGINKISETNKFLPMSVQEEWVPTKGVKPIYLVRLVSRLKVRMRNNTNHPITVTGLTLNKFNTIGNLFKEDKFSEMTGNGYSIENLFQSVELEAAMKDFTESDWYYVNESEATKGFEVKLETTSDKHPTDNNPHQGTKFTALRQIPRNHVWNLNIEFTSYQLTLLSVSNENPPIGGYPESSTSNGITDLVCTVYGGGPFTITIEKLISQENNDGDISQQVDWSIGNVNMGDLLAEAPNNVTKIDKRWQITGGRMVGAATEEQSATFELIAKKDGVVLATFQIQLKFADIFSQKP